MTLSSDGRDDMDGFATCNVLKGDVVVGRFDSRMCAACAACEGSVTFALSGGAVLVLELLV